MRTLRLHDGYTDELVVDLTDMASLDLSGVELRLALTAEGAEAPDAADPLWRAAGTGAVARVVFSDALAKGHYWLHLQARQGSAVYLVPVLDLEGHPEHVLVV